MLIEKLIKVQKVLLSSLGKKILWMHLQNGGMDFIFGLGGVGTH